jgi:signal peptidase
MLISVRTRQGIAILFFLLIMFLGNNFISGRLTGLWGIYVLPAVFWSLLALVVWFRLGLIRSKMKARHRKMFYWAGFICGMATVLAVFAVGLLEGMGRSPYDHSFSGIVINLFYLGSMLVGMEISRAWLMNSLFAKRQVVGIVFTGIIYSLFGFSLRRLAMFETSLDMAKFVGSTFIPVISENILASYLVSLAGPLPAIIYRGVLAAFHWFSPILPDLNWITQAMVSTFVPAFCMVLVYQLHKAEVLRVRKRDSESPVGWIVASVISVLIVWFAVGVFSIFPTAIVTGSMSPAIEQGDIAIIKRITPGEVKIDDILLFQLERARIAHRVVDIKKDERGLPLFYTKGDANDRIDSDPVLAEQVVGKVIHVIPRAGWITIWWRISDHSWVDNVTGEGCKI